MYLATGTRYLDGVCQGFPYFSSVLLPISFRQQIFAEPLPINAFSPQV